MTVAPPLNPDEPDRQASLDRSHILNTPIEAQYERLTRRAQREFGAAMCSISLVDDEREWYKAVQGSDSCQGGREASFCGHAILYDNVFVVEDAAADDRFKNNPQVINPPHVRFYAGAQIRDADGRALGMFCVKDTAPRILSDADRRKLQAYAKAAETYIKTQFSHGIEAKFAASVGKERLGSLVDPVTRLWNREGITRIATQLVNSDNDANLNNMPHGCGVMFVQVAAATDSTMRDVALKLLDVLRDLDVVGRYEDGTFLALLVGCKDAEHTRKVCACIADRLVAPPSDPADPVFPSDAMLIQCAAVFLPFVVGASLDDAILEARQALRSAPEKRTAA